MTLYNTMKGKEVKKMNNKLYLRAFEYNTYIILNEIIKRIYNNGGFLVSEWKPTQEPFIIYNRTLQNNIKELKESIQTIESNLENNNYNDDRKKQLIEYKQKKEEELKSIENINDERIVFNSSYLQFRLDDYIYYMQFDSNPFFNHYMVKQRIDETKNNKYITSYNHYYDIFSLDIFNDIDLFRYNLTDDEIKQGADILFNMLINAKESKAVMTRQREYCYHCNKYTYKQVKEVNKKEYKEVIINESELKKNDI